MPTLPSDFHTKLNDPFSERMLITALLKHGSEAFFIIDETVKEQDFFYPENKIIFITIKSLILNEELNKPGIHEIVAFIQRESPKADEKYDFLTYISALNCDTISLDNLKPFCRNVARLSLARNLQSRLRESIEVLDNINASDSIPTIISKAEYPIVEFTNSMVHQVDTTKIANIISDYVELFANRQPGQRGIPSGFPIFDYSIGGGLRKPGVHLIGARAGVGKSALGLNIAHKLVKSGIPVLYLDTELTEEITISRLLACESGIKIDDIEEGTFTHLLEARSKINEASNNISKLPFYYHNISGMEHEEYLSVIRRWILKEVGFDENGNTKDCLIVLDYIKTMNLSALGQFTEWQYLGQVITDLHNFAIKYNIPILSMAQLNREGISSDHQGVLAGSDRLIALCSSFSILRKKATEDFTDDPLTDISGNPIPSSGDRKLTVIKTRFGKGLDEGEYINICTDLSIGRIWEGKTNTYNRALKNNIQTSNSTTTLIPQTNISNDDDDDTTTPF